MVKSWRKRRLNWKRNTETQNMIIRSVCIQLLMNAQRKECSWDCSGEAMLTSSCFWQKRRAAATRESSHQHPEGSAAPHWHTWLQQVPSTRSWPQSLPCTPGWGVTRPGWPCSKLPCTNIPLVGQLRAQAFWLMTPTAQIREPSLFHAKAVMVYRWAISLGLPSSQALRRGLQFRTRNLWDRW